MTEKSFETLQTEIVGKLKECFNLSRDEVLKIEPTLSEWKTKLQKLEQFKDPNTLNKFLLDQLDLSSLSPNQLEEIDQEALLDPLRSGIQEYLNFLPFENIDKAAQVLEEIRNLPLDSYQTTCEFVKLRSHLSHYLNHISNEKCRRFQADFSELLESAKIKIGKFVEEYGSFEEKAKELLERSSNKEISLEPQDPESIITHRYNIGLKNKDLLSLKEREIVSKNVVDFFGMYLNERNAENKILFLDHNGIGLQTESKEQINEEKTDFNERKSIKSHFNIGEKPFWEQFEKVCIPYTVGEGEWSLIVLEDKGSMIWLIELIGSSISRDTVKDIINRVREFISDKDQEEGELQYKSKKITSQDEGQSSLNSGHALLWEMFILAEKKQELKEGEDKLELGVNEFIDKVLETCVLIGINNEGFLKYDELL